MKQPESQGTFDGEPLGCRCDPAGLGHNPAYYRDCCVTELRAEVERLSSQLAAHKEEIEAEDTLRLIAAVSEPIPAETLDQAIEALEHEPCRQCSENGCDRCGGCTRDAALSALRAARSEKSRGVEIQILEALERVRAESLELACKAVCQWCVTVGQSPNVEWEACDEAGFHPAKGCTSTYKNFGECRAWAIRRAFAEKPL